MSLCLIGHTDYSLSVRSSERSLPFGEINNAKKLHRVLKAHGLPVTDVFDLYELCGIERVDSPDWHLFQSMSRTNSTLGLADLELITDYRNPLVDRLRCNLKQRLAPYGEGVLLLLTWNQEALALLSTGIQDTYPVVGKEDSYILGSYQTRLFPMRALSRELDLVVSESLLGAVNTKEYGYPAKRFLYLPNLAPSEATAILEKDLRPFRHHYFETLSKRHRKPLPPNSIVVGCPTRMVRRKNVEMLIWAMNELVKEFPNLYLVIKGALDPECDDMTHYSEKLHQLLKGALQKPWFFWDQELTPYQEVLPLYRSFDLVCLPTGAEIGCNTIVEVCALGIPCVLTDASVIPYLYKEMALFVKGGEYTVAPWVFPQPDLDDLIAKLRQLIAFPRERASLGERARKLAIERFGEQQLIKRIPLLIQAAQHFHKNQQEEEMEEKLFRQLKEDFHTYSLPESLL